MDSVKAALAHVTPGVNNNNTFYIVNGPRRSRSWGVVLCYYSGHFAVGGTIRGVSASVF